MEAEFTEKSIDTVRKKILQKTSPYPSFSTNQTVINVVTDHDHHPYTRWFRGVSYFPEPIIAEREAGWRPVRDSCYDLIIPYKQGEEPTLCFEAPCTTTFPCIPEVSQKYADRKALDTAINKQCIVQYR